MPGMSRYAVILGIFGFIVYAGLEYMGKKTGVRPAQQQTQKSEKESTPKKQSQEDDSPKRKGRMSKRACKSAMNNWLFESREQLQQRKPGDFLYLVALRMGLCSPITLVDLAMFSKKLAPRGNGVKNTLTLSARDPNSTAMLCDTDALNLMPLGYIRLNWEYDAENGASCRLEMEHRFTRKAAFNLTDEQDVAFQTQAGKQIAEKEIKKRVFDPATFVGSAALPEVVRRAIDLNFKSISKCGYLGDKCKPGICPTDFQCFEEHGCAACAIQIPERILVAEKLKNDMEKRKLEAIHESEMRAMKENQEAIPVATAEQEAERNEVMTCSAEKETARANFCKINPGNPCCSPEKSACGQGKKCCLSYEKCLNGWSLKSGKCVSVLSYCN